MSDLEVSKVIDTYIPDIVEVLFVFSTTISVFTVVIKYIVDRVNKWAG